MKKLVSLILILIITPLLITSEKTIGDKALKISIYNTIDPETSKWEYVKMKAFDKNGVIQKGYDKPVNIILGRDFTLKDSISVAKLVSDDKIWPPNVSIGFNSDTTSNISYHDINLSFSKNIFGKNNFYRNEYQHSLRRIVLGNVVIGRGILEPKHSGRSSQSFINFDFNDTTADDYRRTTIAAELLHSIINLNEYVFANRRTCKMDYRYQKNIRFRIRLNNACQHPTQLPFILTKSS